MRERSILLYRDAMEVAVSCHREQMGKDVQRSLMPLFFHLHDKDHSVAQVGISKPSECAAAGALRRAQSPCLPAAAELAAAEKVAGTFPTPALPDPAEHSSSARPQRPKHWSPVGFPAVPAGV